jgi:hypothetical protein
MMAEGDYKTQLIKKIKKMFPGCIVLKNDEQYLQGISDLTVLWYDSWALLEVKVSKDAKRQPNQPHYVAKGKDMCFGAFIHPENEQEVLRELQQAFTSPSRRSRISQP